MANFLPTTAGMNAATVAVGGPKINITPYKVGTSTQPPTQSDTGLVGSTLHVGAVTQVYPVSDGTANIVVQMGPTVGPFPFGEVALFLDNGVCFARMAYDSVQEKISSLTSGLGSTWTLNCLVKLGHAVAGLQYTLKTTNEVLTLQGSGVQSPAELSTASTQANLIVAKIPTPEYAGSGVMTPVILTRRDNNTWDVESYSRRGSVTAQAGTTQNVLVADLFGQVGQVPHVSRQSYNVLLQSPTGRIVTGTVLNDGTKRVNLAYNCPWLSAGVSVEYHYWDDNSYQMMESGFLHLPTIYQPTSGGAPYEVGLRGRPSGIWSDTVTDLTQLNGTILNVTGGPLQLPDLPTLRMTDVKNAGFELHLFNSSPTSKLTLTAPAGGSFRTVGQYNGFGYSSTSRELGPKGSATFTYVNGGQGSWEIYVKGDGILGFNFGGSYLIGQPIELPFWQAPLPGFLPADGASLYDSTAYPEYWSLVGTRFNQAGDPPDKFRTADHRGRFIRGWDSSGTVDPSRLLGSYQEDAIKSHEHPIQMRGSNDDNGDPGTLVETSPGQDNGVRTMHADTKALAPVGSANETRPKNIAYAVYIFVGR